MVCRRTSTNTIPRQLTNSKIQTVQHKHDTSEQKDQYKHDAKKADENPAVIETPKFIEVPTGNASVAPFLEPPVAADTAQARAILGGGRTCPSEEKSSDDAGGHVAKAIDGQDGVDGDCGQPREDLYTEKFLITCLSEFVIQQRHKWSDRARVRLAKQFLIDSGYVKAVNHIDAFAVFRAEPLRSTLEAALQAVKELHPT